MDLTVALSFIALLPLAVYFLQRALYAPRLFFRIGGEHNGEPIRVPKAGDLLLALGTASRRKVVVSEIWVGYDPTAAQLSKTKGAVVTTAPDEAMSSALFYGERAIVTRNRLHGIGITYATPCSEFEIKLTAFASIDETELPIILDMFPPRRVRVQRAVRFQASEGASSEPKDLGLRIAPGESVNMEGPAAQSGFSLTADGPVKAHVTTEPGGYITAGLVDGNGANDRSQRKSKGRHSP